MWLETGKSNKDNARVWFNTDHIVRVEFIPIENTLTATVITVKPGGSDKSILKGDDAQILYKFFQEQNDLK